MHSANSVTIRSNLIPYPNFSPLTLCPSPFTHYGLWNAVEASLRKAMHRHGGPFALTQGKPGSIPMATRVFRAMIIRVPLYFDS